jgi:hypothetical protein
MTARRSIQLAAAALLNELAAPPGYVNTMASFDDAGPVIRVLVDPAYWYTVRPIPTQYRGYRVTVEKREPTYAVGGTR